MTDVSGLSSTDSANTVITAISIAENCPSANINDAQRATLGAMHRDWERRGPTVTAGGTATAITLTYGVAPTAYVAGDTYSFLVGSVNTGATTVNVNTLGAKNITKNGTTALQGGELAAGSVATVMYDGTQFQLISNNVTEATAFWGGTSGGSANAQTATLVPVPGACYAGMQVVFKAGFTNTGATTLNANSLGAKNVFVANAACAGGEIVANTIYEVVYDGTQFQMLSPQSTQHGALIGLQLFTAAGTATYTPTAGTNSVVVEVVGGGGGGGGAAAASAGQAAIGEGGGGGGYALKRITSAFSGVTVTVGAKGTGGTSGANAGNNGGTSSFGALVSATGGTGGGGGVTTAVPFATANQAAGAGASGDINLSGSRAMRGLALSSTVGISGGGGMSGRVMGAQSSQQALGVAGNNALTGFGNGGGGGTCAASGSATTGGDGSVGVVIVWEYN